MYKSFSVREAGSNDMELLLQLYTQLHNNPFPDIDDRMHALWNRLIRNPDHHLLLGFENEILVSSCVVIIIENLTHGQKPYALIENVITHPSSRNRGYATNLLHKAAEIAQKKNCYKIMLMTSSKKESTLKFYQKAGFNANDKTAFIRWL